ncbi:MAG: hypothetical protein LBB43_06750 [Spirochaetaceae bacterium]|jgi:hypothetical protein|nr:hypothetical protein [Spirochaetaceae bacterium]
MAKREKQEKDQWYRILEETDFKRFGQRGTLATGRTHQTAYRKDFVAAIGTEMDMHLGYEKHDSAEDDMGTPGTATSQDGADGKSGGDHSASFKTPTEPSS